MLGNVAPRVPLGALVALTCVISVAAASARPEPAAALARAAHQQDETGAQRSKGVIALSDLSCPIAQYPGCQLTHNPPAARYTDDSLFDLRGKTLRFNFGPSRVTTDWASTISPLEEVVNPYSDVRFDFFYSKSIELPFVFSIPGSNISTVYPYHYRGSVGFAEPEPNAAVSFDWNHFWQLPQLAALGQRYSDWPGETDLYLAVDEDAGHVVLRFDATYADDSDFTVLISSENFIQVTYHAVDVSSSGAIVGVSFGEQPSTDWEEIETTDDWSCAADLQCVDCPPGTASTAEGTEECQPCPGNGCNGHGTCDPATAVCECINLFTGAGCTEQDGVCSTAQGRDCPVFDVTHNPPAAHYTPESFNLLGRTLRYNFGRSKVTTDWAEPVSELEDVRSPEEDPRFEELFWVQDVDLPFIFNVLGTKISTVCPDLYRGTVYLVKANKRPYDWSGLWETFWELPQVAGLLQDSASDLFVAADEDAGHVVFAFRSQWGDHDFTVLISSENFIQVTYRAVDMYSSGAIVGVSFGEQPSTDWEEIETTDDWSCAANLQCVDCPPGTASTAEDTEECQPCPGNGCNGHGTCDPATAVCECTEPYTGAGCTELEDVVCPIAQGTDCPAFDVTHNPPAAHYTPESFNLLGRTLRYNFGRSKVTTDWAEPVSELEDVRSPEEDPRFERFWATWDQPGVDLPFIFNVLGTKISTVYPDPNRSTVYFANRQAWSDWNGLWEAFWELPQVAGFQQWMSGDSYDAYIAVDKKAGHVVIAFLATRFNAMTEVSEFTVLISSENFIQVTYHAVEIWYDEGAIVGVSLGKQPQVGWEEIETIDDWSCAAALQCVDCPPGTASTAEDTNQCEPCPGDGCSGRGKCNPATAVCECTGLYTGDGCEERQNVAASMAFGFITLVLVLAFGIPCICFGKAHAMTKGVSQRVMDPFLWKVVVNMDVARHFKNMVAQKQALAFLHEEQEKRKVPPGTRLKKFLAAFTQLVKVLTVLGIAFFIIYMATFLQMIGNVFLLARGLFSTNLSELEDRMSDIYTTLRDFFSTVDFGWLADFLVGILETLRNIDFRVIAIGGMDVTCDGSQAPGLLFVNLMVAAGIVLLITLGVFPFLKITLRALVGTFGDMLAIRRMMGQNASRMIIVALSAMVAGLEGLFKYGVQMGASLMEFEAFFPRHRSNEYCDESSASMDTTLAVLSTVLAFMFFPPIIHILLVTFVPGIPKDVEFPSWEEYKAERQKQDGRLSVYGSMKRKVENLEKRARNLLVSKGLSEEATLPDKPSTKLIERFKPADPDLDASWVLNHATFAETKAARETAMNFEPVPNVPTSNVLLKLIYHELVYKSYSTRTLQLYIYCMAWKVWKLVQISFGYWDDEAIRAFHIRELAEKFDDDVGDDNNHHTSMISLVGVSHPLMWQLFSGAIVLSKLAEAINEDEHPPFIVAKNSGITVQSMWSDNDVKLAPGGTQEEVEELPGGRIVEVLAVRPTKMRNEGGEKQNGVAVVVRGYCTNFEEDVEKQGVLLLGSSPSADVHDEPGLLKVQVDEIINDVCLRGTMAEDDFKKLPRFLVHRLQDYEVDQSSLKGFIKEKKTACAVCYSVWNCCTRCLCCCCCCCCCCCNKTDEEAGVSANRMDRNVRQPNGFAAKIEKLGSENRALPYKIKNKTKHVLVRFVQWGRGLFAGRLYKCLVRVSRFGTELGFVLMPSMLWLQLFFVVSLPSILINTIRTLESCGIEFDELKELLADPLDFLCGNLGELVSSGVQAADMDRLSGVIEMVSDPVSHVTAMFGDDLPNLPDAVSDVVGGALEESGVLEELQTEAINLVEAAKSQLGEAVSGADKQAEVELPEETEPVVDPEDGSSSAGEAGLLPDVVENSEEEVKDAAEVLNGTGGLVSRPQPTGRDDEGDADEESQHTDGFSGEEGQDENVDTQNESADTQDENGDPPAP